ncbi:GDSL esterase/lipase [Melia azedarach]|uniref:GDSL esterase/lipase n=1 Tax=Melia azedarach TaxID=155640 RepID=A0ACC1YPN4_MELAZ|nr:GDSL esterase/lipase [Melia azedarach]
MAGCCNNNNNNIIFREIFLLFLGLSMSFSSFSQAQMVPAIFAFGDSLIDVGNNNYLPVSIVKANFPHNGVDFSTKKPTGRFSNGKNAADFLSEKVGLPTSPPYLSLKSNKNNASFLTGVSFASGGAGIFNGSDQALHQSLPLTKQVSSYVTIHGDLVQQLGSSAEQYFSKSLFAIVIGSNDIFGYFGSSDLRKKSTPQQYVDLMATTLKGQLKILYAHGARKFVFAGLGLIGCAPSQRVKNQTEECNEEVNYWSAKYNEALKSALQELKSELKGMAYSYFETYTVMQDIIQNPAARGFTEVKSACCGLGKLKAKIPCVPVSTYCPNRSNHVFWDLYHPTEAIARIFVDTILDGPSQYTFPINVRHLVAA